MVDQIAIEAYDGTKRHVDSTIKEADFLDATRTMVYAATVKAGTTDTPDKFRKVGLIQSYGWNEQKELSQIYEIGSDISYMVPGRTRGSISISRILLSGKDLLNALYSGDVEISQADFLKSLGDVNVPIYLMFVSTGSSNQFSNGATVYSRVFANCHITSRNESIGAGQRIIMEGVSIAYSHIIEASVKVV